MRYFDAFAGKGSYEDGDEIGSFDHQQPCKFCTDRDCKACGSCQICKTGTPILAIQAALGHMRALQTRVSFRNGLKETGLTCLKAVEFIFNDTEQKYMVELYDKIRRCFSSLGWQEEDLDVETCPVYGRLSGHKNERAPIRIFRSVDFTGTFMSDQQSTLQQSTAQQSTVQQSFRIHFTVGRFEDLEFKPDPDPKQEVPLFSLIDPFGVGQIPMSAVRPLIGDNKAILLTLMVAALDK